MKPSGLPYEHSRNVVLMYYSNYNHYACLVQSKTKSTINTQNTDSVQVILYMRQASE